MTVGRLVAFLVGLVVVGLLIVPRAIRAVTRLNRRETTLVACIGICFAIALLAQEFGYSVALGAFIAGSSRRNRGRKQVETTSKVRYVRGRVLRLGRRHRPA
jgi:CPA2 family monovalent cation:H+ antiporter-2